MDAGVAVSTRETVDSEILKIRKQIQSLTSRRDVLSSVLAGSSSTRDALHSPRAQRVTKQSRARLEAARKRVDTQQRHSETQLHRLCAGATLFEVHDPDPHAVDHGRVLGVRIESATGGQFKAPHYLLLTRLSDESPALKVHKHTVPPNIPLKDLLARHLPDGEEKRQNMPRLVHELRRELASFDLRKDAVDKLNTRLQSRVAVTTNDAEALHVQLAWKSGAMGRVRISKAGEMLKCVVFDSDGHRDRSLERKLLGLPGDRRLEALGKRV